MLRWIAWNLFLAAVPVGLAAMIGWGAGGKGRKRRLPSVLLIAIALVWLAFLPNTCYLLTEWRHLLFDARWEAVLDAGHVDRGAMLSTAKWSLFFLAYSGSGVLLFALAIRPVEGLLRARGYPPYLYAPFFFALVSFGVYLGLIVRLNSWDLVTRPEYVWQVTVDSLASTRILAAVGAFALILWGLYEAVDLWVDGVAGRLRAWGVVSAPRGRA
ncbi:MAG: DUF1361 domain-containing protein [Chthonomonadales bacterium]|nr:DUF1361 domain-containing protein [Chthonomonadales bacterium]